MRLSLLEYFLAIVDIYTRGRVLYWLAKQVIVNAVALVVGGDVVDASHILEDVNECAPLIGVAVQFGSSSRHM